MISTLPSIYRLAGIWLAALATMIYVYSLSDIDWIVKVIGFVPVLAVAIYLMSKFRKYLFPFLMSLVSFPGICFPSGEIPWRAN